MAVQKASDERAGFKTVRLRGGTPGYHSGKMAETKDSDEQAGASEAWSGHGYRVLFLYRGLSDFLTAQNSGWTNAQ